MTIQQTAKEVEYGTEEWHDVLGNTCTYYSADGTPYGNHLFCFPDNAKEVNPKWDAEEDAAKWEGIAEAAAEMLNSGTADDSWVLKAFGEESLREFNDLPDVEKCWVLNDIVAQCGTLSYTDAGNMLVDIHQALVRLGVEDPAFGPEHDTVYTYNDGGASYCGFIDIQVTYPKTGGDSYPAGDILFLQYNPGGDARNMSHGQFRIPEAIDDFHDLFERLGSYAYGSDVEVPQGFPLVEYLNAAGSSDLRAVLGLDDPRYPHSVGRGTDVDPALTRYYLEGAGNHRGPASEKYAIAEFLRQHTDSNEDNLWEWVPAGCVFPLKLSTVGISADWQPAYPKFSTDGYWKWVGPMPGSAEFERLLDSFEKDEDEDE